MERTQLNFGDAIAVLKVGGTIARKGWNGKGMFLYLFSKRIFSANDIEYSLENLKVPLNKKHEETYEICDFIVLKTADNKIIPWQPSQADVLAEDWEIIQY